jgi:hypothetical protein
LPAETYSALAKARAPVPSLFDADHGIRITSMFSPASSLRIAQRLGLDHGRFSPVRLSVMYLTRCGRNITPLLAMVAVACASWIGV